MPIKTILNSLLLCVCGVLSYAQTPTTGAETIFPDNPDHITTADNQIIDPELYRKNESFFLANYARNAADSALIKLTFANRRTAGLLASLGSILGGTGVGALLFIPAGVMYSRYSRHNLYAYVHREANLDPKVRRALLESMGYRTGTK